MEVLSFDIEGKFAHFRKYYANNTAFTFGLPPRTTLMGIIAGAVGFEKDSYYEDFKSENIKLGVAVLSPIKKSFHRLNYLMVKGDSDFRGKQKHIQTPFEIISGIDQRYDYVKYRIFVAPGEKGNNIYGQIKETFLSRDFRYNTSLGTANFSAKITNVITYKDVKSRVLENEKVALNSAGLSKDIIEITFEKNDDFRYLMIEEELMPAEFKANKDREVVKMNRILFTTGGVPLNIKMTGTVYELINNGQKQIIQFLE